jgi:hypothetical protein
MKETCHCASWLKTIFQVASKSLKISESQEMMHSQVRIVVSTFVQYFRDLGLTTDRACHLGNASARQTPRKYVPTRCRPDRTQLF